MELTDILIQFPGLYLESNKASRECVEHKGKISQLGFCNPGWGPRGNKDRHEHTYNEAGIWLSNINHLNLEPQNAYEVQHRSGLPNSSRRPLEARSLEASRLRLRPPMRRKPLLLVFAQRDQSSINIHTRTLEESLATALELTPRK